MRVKTFEEEDKVRAIISKYIHYYNTKRPHSAIGFETPVAFNENLYTIKL